MTSAAAGFSRGIRVGSSQRLISESDMDLPIDVVVGTSPPQFRWRQSVSTLVGEQLVTHTGTLPPNVEGAVAALIFVVKSQLRAIEELKKTNQSLTNQVSSLKKTKGDGK